VWSNALEVTHRHCGLFLEPKAVNLTAICPSCVSGRCLRPNDRQCRCGAVIHVGNQDVLDPGIDLSLCLFHALAQVSAPSSTAADRKVDWARSRTWTFPFLPWAAQVPGKKLLVHEVDVDGVDELFPVEEAAHRDFLALQLKDRDLVRQATKVSLRVYHCLIRA
jgi:hypothetical protein